jgi:hypothetical protein
MTSKKAEKTTYSGLQEEVMMDANLCGVRSFCHSNYASKHFPAED